VGCFFRHEVERFLYNFGGRSRAKGLLGSLQFVGI